MIKFNPAVEGECPFILGLSGPSRSGKTYSALRVASGMASTEKVFLIDTENSRSTQYVNRFGPFMHFNLEPPFSYARYLEAIRAAVEAKAEVIIVDSVSHSHEGKGGLLEQHEAALERIAGKDWGKRERVKFTAWIEPKKEMTDFILSVQRMSVPMIFCFRAKEKMKMIRGDKGRMEPTPIGFRAIASDELSFEMSSMLMFPENGKGIPDLDAPGAGLREPFDSFIPAGKPLSEKTGERLMQWVHGTKAEASETAIQEEDIQERAREIAGDGVEALQKFYYGQLTRQEQKCLKPIVQELHIAAMKADEVREAP